MITLGIESSCDDTSVALVEDGTRVLTSLVSSQIEIHRRFGGVVPEVASRKHLEAILPLLDSAMTGAGLTYSAIGQIAVTAGPGLLGPLLIGLSTAKALAWHLKVPLIPVNHIEAHLTASFLAAGRRPEYPFLGLIVSGGHANLVFVTGPRDFRLMARTLDDAPGELFDKVARHLGIGYPGGPVIQKTGENGDPKRYRLPRPMAGKGYVFSFSGLKTAVMRIVEQEGDRLNLADLCAGLQAAVADSFAEKVSMALDETAAKRLVMAGGVAANQPLRARMQELANRHEAELLLPTIHLCTDNAAMIAAHGYCTADTAPANSLEVNAVAGWAMGGPHNF
ncbi:MAG TPA: tRNA (adenosine(37)-N6)-threonylcarbamoyltransferase complex transferase subunit TsaD [Candidatus Rifleibacterium sp.]|nr:tRNA (adenosine(37)-N6)-threonylcarbamoyltransferase complex transferase subunit TsaD [Candidatus Rifleibacterium sp.]HPT46307.1 tRNA (adenosine(37)-N6)-threonylcarbamoyltransferase complex transferase subunit TsaD [Candidatus Rifleibacterium sp.]